MAPLITSLPSLDPHVSCKQREPDREERNRRQFRHRGARGWSTESRIGCHSALAPKSVSPVVDACVDYRRVSRAPPVIGCAHLIELVVPELPLVTPIVLYITVCDDAVIRNRVACASALQVEACLCVVLHPVAGDIVVARRIQVDAVAVRVRGVARERVVIARRIQVDAVLCVPVRGVLLERVVARRTQPDAVAVRVRDVARERVVIARRFQVDAVAVRVRGVARERVVARRFQADAVLCVPVAMLLVNVL